MNEELFELIKQGVSPFHTVQACEKVLKECGFQSLDMKESWKLEGGENYYVKQNGSTLFAFTMPEQTTEQSRFRIAAAHTDFPCLRIKPHPEMISANYLQVNTEVYGGAILNTWLDRPLSVAGRVALRTENVFAPEIRLIDFHIPMLTIPNLAIHMNREVNKGIELNKQKDMMPVLGMLDERMNKERFFLDGLADYMAVKPEDILDFELNLYNTDQPCFVGWAEEMISSPRIDNISSIAAILYAMTDAVYTKKLQGEDICVAAFFDHEEVGSGTKQGAGSMLLRDILERIMESVGQSGQDVNAALYRSMLLSVDVAHALHPNKVEKCDVTNKPVLNQGFCIKEACAQSYATDSEAIAIVEQLCQAKNIPYQKYVNRSDEPGGGTLGAIASRMLPVKTVDIGVGMLAMHSARETMGSKDMKSLYQLLGAYYTM